MNKGYQYGIKVIPPTFDEIERDANTLYYWANYKEQCQLIAEIEEFADCFIQIFDINSEYIGERLPASKRKNILWLQS